MDEFYKELEGKTETQQIRMLKDALEKQQNKVEELISEISKQNERIEELTNKVKDLEENVDLNEVEEMLDELAGSSETRKNNLSQLINQIEQVSQKIKR